MDTSDVDRRTKLQASRLREARMARGFKSARAAAIRFHWAEDTYQKHERGERGIGRAVRKYARAFRVEEAWLLGLQEEKSSTVRGIPIVGEAALGRWNDVDITTATLPIGRVSAPSKHNSEEDGRFAIRLMDASMNREMPQGSFGVCVDADDDATAADFVVGDIVYIERQRGALAERSFRRVTSKTNSTLKLSTHSSDPRLRSDLAYPSERSDEKIRIVGKLVGRYVDYQPA